MAKSPHPNVMISSTARDLPLHRKEAMDACLRRGMFPIMMEHLPAVDADAITISLKMVDEAELYIGIFGHRYGYIPEGNDISITEMEYNRAVEQNIPCLIFLMHEEHPVLASDVEKGEGAVKLEKLKTRLRKEKIVAFFKSPDDLRGRIIDSLVFSVPTRDFDSIHFVSDIPQPPETYIAHPYTLLQTAQVIGREKELAFITDWATNSTSSIFNFIVALGGMGKSALTWKWFNEVAPKTMAPLAGRMWWSFYESDASFENFLSRALAYVSQRPKKEIEKLPVSERESQLLAILNQEPYLIVWDGFERVMVAYARMDAARMADDDLDEKTGNYTTIPRGLSDDETKSFSSKYQLRKTTDPRVGIFLRKLTTIKKSRILVSTRLYPAELQTVTGDPMPGSQAYFLRGLEDEDALALWDSFHVSGSSDVLLPLFHSFENYPLLIRALAGEVATNKSAPGNFDIWKQNYPDFNPLKLPAVNVKSHVLRYATQGLNEKSHSVLSTVAAFRMPVSYHMLAKMLVTQRRNWLTDVVDTVTNQTPVGIFSNEQELDRVLVDLEERGLLGWDKRANRYDLHPIVRSITWETLALSTQQKTYTAMQKHFGSPTSNDQVEINRIEDLTSTIEFFHTLIGLKQYGSAFTFFKNRLEFPMMYRLSATRESSQLLEAFFPNGAENPPQLTRVSEQANLRNRLGLTYKNSGLPQKAAENFRRVSQMYQQRENSEWAITSSHNLSHALYFCGNLFEAESAALESLKRARNRGDIFSEAIALQYFGMSLAVRRGSYQQKADTINYEVPLKRARRIFKAYNRPDSEGFINICLAQTLIWEGNIDSAFQVAEQATQQAKIYELQRDLLRAQRRVGMIALAQDHLTLAEEVLHDALRQSRVINFSEEELPILIGLAESGRQKREFVLAKELLNDTWELIERGPYILFHADALNTLARIEHDSGNLDAALQAALDAYHKAWCDGPPFTYYWGLEEARAILKDLGRHEPSMPAVDTSRYTAMPRIEIDLADEFSILN